MIRAILFSVLFLIPLSAIAGEKVKGKHFFVVDQQTWKTGEDTGYWIWHGKGISVSAEGPLGSNPVECHGAGYWDRDRKSILHRSRRNTKRAAYRRRSF